MAVSLQQITQILSGVPFRTAHVSYDSTHKTKNIFNRDGILFLPLADTPHVYVRAWTLCCFHSLISTQTFRRALTASVDRCAEIKSAPSVA